MRMRDLVPLSARRSFARLYEEVDSLLMHERPSGCSRQTRQPRKLWKAMLQMEDLLR